MEFKEILDKISEKDLELIEYLLSDSEAFKSLAGKTQIKNDAAEGYRDDLNTRQNHSKQVSRIATQIVSSAGMSKKEQQVAGIVGLCHDLGHTPFGHDGEVFFSKKNGVKFEHAKYGVEVFKIAFNEAIQTKEDGKYIFSKETREAFEELGTYIEAGISCHQEGYYTMDMDKEIAEIEKLDPATLSEEQKFKLKAFKTPCIQAAMLSDTVAIMQTDTYDMSVADKPFETGKIITPEMKLAQAKKIGFTDEDIDKMAAQLFKEGSEELLDGKTLDEKLRIIIDAIDVAGPEAMQGIIATSIGVNGLNENGRFESLTDDYKLAADNWFDGYNRLLDQKGEKTISKEEWPARRESILKTEREALKKSNPLLCLSYEIQNELMYNEIIKTDKIKFLGNDLDRNFSIFSRTYDYIYNLSSKEEAQLTPQEIEIKKELDAIENCPEVGDGSDLAKDKTTYYIQQLGNKGIKELYERHLQPKENEVSKLGRNMLKKGYSEFEITQKMGINWKEYDAYSKIDKSKKIAVMLLSGKKKEEILKEMSIGDEEYQSLFGAETTGEKWEIKQPIKVAEEYLKTSGDRNLSEDEILKILRIEKRDLDEIQAGKSTIERYIEYEMELKGIRNVSARIQQLREKKEENKQNDSETKADTEQPKVEEASQSVAEEERITQEEEATQSVAEEEKITQVEEATQSVAEEEKITQVEEATQSVVEEEKITQVEEATQSVVEEEKITQVEEATQSVVEEEKITQVEEATQSVAEEEKITQVEEATQSVVEEEKTTQEEITQPVAQEEQSSQVENESKESTGMLGKESFENVAGDRKVDDLLAIYTEVKEQSRDGKDAKVVENDNGERDV